MEGVIKSFSVEDNGVLSGEPHNLVVDVDATAFTCRECGRELLMNGAPSRTFSEAGTEGSLGLPEYLKPNCCGACLDERRPELLRRLARRGLARRLPAAASARAAEDGRIVWVFIWS